MSDYLTKYELPPKWAWTSLNEIVGKLSTYQKIKKRDYSIKGVLPIVDQSQQFISGYTNDLSFQVQCSLPVVVFGDHTKNIKLVDFAFAGGADGIKILQPFPSLNSKIITYFLMLMKELIPDKGYSRHFHLIEKLRFPLPPLLEQVRIVEKIDNLLNIIEKGEEHIKSAQYQIKLYRESILQKAFTGKLTEQWRNERPQEYAIDLLDYINEQKQKEYKKAFEIWESEVKKWKAENKVGNKPVKPKSQKQLPKLNPELYNLPDLPEEWEWTWSGNLFNGVTSGSRGWAQYYSNSGSVFVRITNMNFNSLELDLTPNKIQYVNPPDNAESQRTKLQAGDFLFSITGYLGMFAISPYLENAYINQHVCLARPSSGYNKKYFGYYAISKSGGHFFLNEKQKGAVKAGLRLDDINRFPVPICSLEEQNIIQQELDIAFASINKLEKLIEDSLNDCTILRQSILKKAFEGKLVPQEPNDEPASELLKKIQKEKQEWQKSQKEKKKTSKPKKRMEALTIEQVLKKAKEPISPKKLWETSKHKHNIEEFYLELKKLGDKVVEIKSETESLLRLEDAN